MRRNLTNGARHPAREQLARLAGSKRALVLTFDDGPGPSLTTSVADVLQRESAPATFFLLGRRAIAHPEVVDMLTERGHELACHTLDHTNAWKCLPHVACRDIDRGYAALDRWIGPDAMFRPPYGKLTPWTARLIRRRGARIGWWTVDSGDTWANPPAPADVAAAISKRGGGVVLLHDFDRQGADRASRAEHVISVVEACIRVARSEGLNIVPLGTLLAPPIAHAQEIPA